ncbi:MAG: hypothetical protein FWH36_04605 [Lentimicrobiaceae bacterium]|nr:hypothetical protein [Lentimicrobiaceae bacterium]
MNKEVSTGYNTFGVMMVVVRYWKMLLLVLVGSAVLSVAASFLVKKQYKSTVVMMPTATNAVSQMFMINNNYNEFLDATQFGDDMKIDQMLQILNSRQMKTHVIEKFNLMEHYGIKETEKYREDKVYKMVADKCRFSRTNYLAAEIIVYDADPQWAADIANEIAAYYDTLKRAIIQQRSKESFAIMEDAIAKTEAYIAALVDSLAVIMSYGVYDYETQSERLTQQYAKEIAAGNTAGIKRIKEQLEILEKWGAASFSLQTKLRYTRMAQVDLQNKYNAMQVDAEYRLPQKFITEYAVPSYKKAYPNRLLIMVITSLCSLLLALFFIFAKESLVKTYKMMKNSDK